MSTDLAAAVTAYTAAVDALVAADVHQASLPDLMEALHDVETAQRRFPVLQHAALARLTAEARPLDFGGTTLVKALAYRTRISTAEASRRFARAADLGPRRGFTGEPMAPLLEHTAAAQARGLISDEHITVIQRFFKKLPDRVDFATRQKAERELAELATRHSPEELQILAAHTLAVLHPDGDFTDVERARKRGIDVGPQQPDGMTYVHGWITPELRALAEPLLAKFAAYGMCNPDDEDRSGETSHDEDQLPFDDTQPDDTAEPDDWGSGERAPAYRDHRTQSQRNHDAALTLCQMLLRTGNLGKLNGLPVTVIVSTTLQDLEAGAGKARTAGGSLLPMADLIRLAAHAHHYLHVYDNHTSETLHLGRSRRCASPAQRLVLIDRDRGCTRPGCTVDGYHSQVHHATVDWKHGGHTNIGDLTLACGADNRMIDTTDWTTQRKDGRTEWIPPPELDTGQARINHFHHPERLIRPDKDDDVP